MHSRIYCLACDACQCCCECVAPAEAATCAGCERPTAKNSCGTGRGVSLAKPPQTPTPTQKQKEKEKEKPPVVKQCYASATLGSKRHPMLLRTLSDDRHFNCASSPVALTPRSCTPVQRWDLHAFSACDAASVHQLIASADGYSLSSPSSAYGSLYRTSAGSASAGSARLSMSTRADLADLHELACDVQCERRGSGFAMQQLYMYSRPGSPAQKVEARLNQNEIYVKISLLLQALRDVSDVLKQLIHTMDVVDVDGDTSPSPSDGL